MKLDRNINPDGRGKYALVNMRKVTEIEKAGSSPKPHQTADYFRMEQVLMSLEVLKREGVLTFGNEDPGQQFMVMKFKDRHTMGGLRGYFGSIQAHYVELMTDERFLERVEKLLRGETLTPEEIERSKEHRVRLRDVLEWADEINRLLVDAIDYRNNRGVQDPT